MSTYYVAGLPYSSELYHHGIKGQHWGRRRFQNEDGSLTAAGYDRYGVNMGDEAQRRGFQPSNNGGNPVTRETISKRKPGMDDETKRKVKKAAKVAAVAVTTGLAAYGAYKVHDKIKKDSKEYLRGLDIARDYGVGRSGFTKRGKEGKAALELRKAYDKAGKIDRIKQVYGKRGPNFYSNLKNSKSALAVDSRFKDYRQMMSTMRKAQNRSNRAAAINKVRGMVSDAAYRARRKRELGNTRKRANAAINNIFYGTWY